MEKTPRKQPKKSYDLLKSIKYVISQAKKGSKTHIAIIRCTVLAMAVVCFFAVKTISGLAGTPSSSEAEVDKLYDKDREALDIEQLGKTVLEPTEDAGKEYVDNTLFIGDSNTVRTMMYGHTTWDNVVAAVSMGIQHVSSLKMTYFEGYSEPVTVLEAVKIIQPQRIIITYGTNNTIGYTVETFIDTYKKALADIKEAYPYADIIINSIPPIDKERENLLVTMQTIDIFNKALADMAKEEGYKFLNSSEALKDPDTGFAKKDYTIGDGIHLSKRGMDAMFDYIRTHAYITEDKRPKPLKAVPKRKETPTGIISEDPLAVRGTRIRVIFQSSDSELGTVAGEVEQKIKRTVTSDPVHAVPNIENGGIFTGWSCYYEGLSSSTDPNVTFKVPKVGDDVTDIVILANFAKASVSITHEGNVKDAISLSKGSSTQLSAFVTEGFTGDKTITWTSDDNSVATVDAYGNVSGVSGGTTRIYAHILGGKIYTSCTVTVEQALEGISISGESNLKVGDSCNLTLNLLPGGAGGDKNNAHWTTDNESVAKVSPLGQITAVSEGTATITATLDGFTAIHHVTVTQPKPLQSISIQGPGEMTEGEKIQLSVVYNPSDTTDSKSAVWSTSDGALASVAEGAVTANSAGTVVISCTVGSHTAQITIVIHPAATERLYRLLLPQIRTHQTLRHLSPPMLPPLWYGLDFHTGKMCNI